MSATMTHTFRLLLIDDDPAVRIVVEGLIADKPITIESAPTAGRGFELVRNWRPDVVVLDHRLPDARGIEILPRFLAFDPQLPILFITAEDTAENAIEAIRRGAFDFFAKPLPLQKLVRSIDQATENRQLLRTPVLVNREQAGAADQLIGRCEEMQRVYKAIGRIAAHDQWAILVGPPGTGKRLVARAIHQHGSRREGPFVSIHCRDQSPELLDKIIFEGHDDLPSALEQAAGGILLLEDFEATNANLQAKLLNLYHEQVNANTAGGIPGTGVTLLLSLSDHGNELTLPKLIRSSLYYELAGNVIELPPLAERGHDLTLLIEHYIRQIAHVETPGATHPPRISDDALDLLKKHDWPGNIAELKSVLRRAIMESRGTIVVNDYLLDTLRPRPPVQPISGRDTPENKSLRPLPLLEAPSVSSLTQDHPSSELQPAAPPLSPASVDWERFIADCLNNGADEGDLYARALSEMERGLISQLLSTTNGNLARSARLLGITRVSLRKKIRSLEIEIPGRPTSIATEDGS